MAACSSLPAREGSYSEQMPDMLLTHLSGKLNALAAKWDAERAKIRTAPDLEARNGFVRSKFREMIHGLPERNALAPVIVSIAFAIPGAMLTEATLSFLGIGIRPPTPTWGAMINEGFVVFSATPWAVLLPAICISIVLLAFTFVGDGLRDALDPRMKT